MKQINILVDDDIKAAYLRFCKRQGMGPNEALVAIVRAWAQAEMLQEAVVKKKLDRTSALITLGKLLEDLQRVVKLNGQFREAVTVAAAQYQVDVKDLGI